MQYSGVYTGLIETPLDAWLFSQINAGNCISLALNKGYGWGADINLKHIFEKLFQDEFGQGYPSHRQASQRQSRQILAEISSVVHRPLTEIAALLPKPYLQDILNFPGFADYMNQSSSKKLYDQLLAI
jgi:hypothetical protein